jgi:hypothetical protein
MTGAALCYEFISIRAAALIAPVPYMRNYPEHQIHLAGCVGNDALVNNLQAR